MTKATLELEEQERARQDICTMPPPQSPVVRRRHPSMPGVFSDEHLVDCQAIPHHLFSPSRQFHHSPSQPKYQEILDYPSPQSVNSSNLDMFLQSPGSPVSGGHTDRISQPPASPLSTGPTVRISQPPACPQSIGHTGRISQPPASPLSGGHTGRIPPTPAQSACLPAPQTRILSLQQLKEETRREQIQNFNKLSKLSSNTKDSPMEVRNSINPKIVKTLVKVRKNPPAPSTVDVRRGPWRSNPELPREPFYPSVSVQNDEQTRKMVYGKSCDVINLSSHIYTFQRVDDSNSFQ